MVVKWNFYMNLLNWELQIYACLDMFEALNWANSYRSLGEILATLPWQNLRNYIYKTKSEFNRYMEPYTQN